MIPWAATKTAITSVWSAWRRGVMEVRMESKKGNVVAGIGAVLTQIQQRLQARPKEWLVALQQDPDKFADLEKEIHGAFAQMADQVVAGLLAEMTADADFAAAAKKK